MYKSYMLRAESEAGFAEACKKASLINDEGEMITSSHNYCLDIIGTVSKPTGEVEIDDYGNEVPVMEVVDGYHANLKCKADIGIEHLAIDVKNPVRKFAGD